MLAAGDTNQSRVAAWAFQQADYVGGNRLLVLLFLSLHAFYRADNPEGAPVGQVLYTYSSLQAIRRGTGLVENTTRAVLWALQAEYGYLRRIPRLQYGGRPTPNVIRIDWSEEFDQMRAAARGGGKLPKAYQVRPADAKVAPGFRLVQGGREDT